MMIDGIQPGKENSFQMHEARRRVSGKDKVFIIIAVVIILLAIVLFFVSSSPDYQNNMNSTTAGGNGLSEEDRSRLVESTSAPSDATLSVEEEAVLSEGTTAE